MRCSSRQRSHELRTALKSIQSFAEVLLSKIDGPLAESQRENVQAVLNAGGILQKRIDEVIDVSSRRTPPVARFEIVHRSGIISALSHLIEAQQSREPVAVEVGLAPDLPTIPAVRRRIRQILLNLGSNARKYTLEGRVLFAAHYTGT